VKNPLVKNLSILVYAILIALVCGCGVKIGNPDKEDDDTQKSTLSEQPEATLQLLAAQINEVLISETLLDGLLGLGQRKKGPFSYFDTSEQSCQIEDDSVNYTFTSSYNVKDAKKGDFNSSYESNGTFSGHGGRISCDEEGSKPVFDKKTTKQFTATEEFNRNDSNIFDDGDKSNHSTYVNKGTRTTTFAIETDEEGSIETTKTVAIHSYELKEWIAEDSGGIETGGFTTEIISDDSSPLVFKTVFDSEGKFQARSVVSGTLATMVDEESKIVVTYNNLAWSSKETCLPVLGTISGEIFDIKDDVQSSSDFTVTVSPEGMTIEFTDGTKQSIQPSVCNLEKSSKKGEKK